MNGGHFDSSINRSNVSTSDSVGVGILHESDKEYMGRKVKVHKNA
jgi:hypothetical protein